ncbi:lysine--tRNA ligase [Schaalia sp. ZJ405]|uniref:lysine--tRNA ligase n=1 Tax=unclassified Schaalia TaxID=2691889 RepID=UPI0013EC8918|nr:MULTISPECIES: lysine--tRNA ligase [unclassified Schaalia]QPK81034.1 lysine--tRNA ligase [Schaalia sp. ZJ405]
MTQAKQNTKTTPDTTDDAPEQIRIRAQKRQRLIDSGAEAYPVVLAITTSIPEVREKYAHLEIGEETTDEVGIAGRVMLQRNGGKLCFATLMDGAGNRIQIMLSAAEVGIDSLNDYKADVDLGDHLFVHGRVISSKRGELSILACPGTAPAGLATPGIAEGEDVPAWKIAAKTLRPLPKTYTAEDGTEVSLSEDMRVRRRYLDMIVRPSARDMVRLRAKVVKSLREYFDNAGFVEIETPMLQNLHGGAAARPFETHMNAYDTELFLRIAPELFLKRAVVGGIDKVFEINRNFRNEGADSSHSPEFTMLEAYEAYGSYDTMARRTREFIQKVARDALGTEIVTLPDGSSYDLSGSWKEISLYDATSDALGRHIDAQTPRDELVAIAQELGEEIPDHYVAGKVAEVIFEKTVGDSLDAPTFVRDFPEDSSPLTRGHRTKPGVVEKWDLYVRGFELATAYSELVDPVIQRQRFEAQALAAAEGDPEAMILDEDFLMAMEYGMPPAGGMGMGLDRLLMALTGQGIRETITFPLVKKL